MSYIIECESIPAEAIADCSESGPVDDAVDYWVRKLKFDVPAADARNYLQGFGAWNAEELADHEQNLRRVFWLACGQFSDDEDETIVCLER